ncbi:MAG: hypothetical protein ACI8TA_003589 [Cyclobacteriaceae bacterium]|jgi:hypothetical protein
MPHWKVIGFYIFGILATIAGIYMIKKGQLIGWTTAGFFGLGTILFTIKFFYPNFKWVNFTTLDGSDTKSLSKEEFMKRYGEDGIFNYTDTGFICNLNTRTIEQKWSDIQTLLGYKKDLLTYDIICLTVYLNNQTNFVITEETHGWFNFLQKVAEHLNESLANWEIEIMDPAFEAKTTIVFDSQNRNLEQIQQEQNSM